MPCTLCGSDYHSATKCPWRVRTLIEWSISAICAAAVTGALGYLVYAAIAAVKGLQ